VIICLIFYVKSLCLIFRIQKFENPWTPSGFYLKDTHALRPTDVSSSPTVALHVWERWEARLHLIYWKKKKKGETREKRKIEKNFIAPASCIVLAPFLIENLRRDAPFSCVVHPYPTRMNTILISLSSSRW